MRLQNIERWELQTCTEVCALPTKWIDCPAEKGAMAHSRRHGPRPEEKRGVKLRSPNGRRTHGASFKDDRCRMATAWLALIAHYSVRYSWLVQPAKTWDDGMMGRCWINLSGFPSPKVLSPAAHRLPLRESISLNLCFGIFHLSAETWAQWRWTDQS